jgi:glucose-1-phosphate cytidylyltransferase
VKVAILCGGKGTRLRAAGEDLPKALVEIGGRPVLWHLMRGYAAQGFDDFVLCLGHRGDEIRRYFEAARPGDAAWRLTFAETGEDTNTGGRVKRVQHLIGEAPFMLTYGDGLADIDLRGLAAFHAAHGRTGTVTVVRPASPFGIVDLGPDGLVARFREKPPMQDWVNGGFFVFQPAFFDLLADDDVLESGPLQRLAEEGGLVAFRHTGFWRCMDTYKDTLQLNACWASGRAPWKVW